MSLSGRAEEHATRGLVMTDSIFTFFAAELTYIRSRRHAGNAHGAMETGSDRR
jgi:hypothetical protein